MHFGICEIIQQHNPVLDYLTRSDSLHLRKNKTGFYPYNSYDEIRSVVMLFAHTKFLRILSEKRELVIKVIEVCVYVHCN